MAAFEDERKARAVNGLRRTAVRRCQHLQVQPGRQIHNIAPTSVGAQGQVGKCGDAPCSRAAAIRGRMHAQQC